jgi:hypothetical protein
MKTKQIAEILTEWWLDEKTCGEKHCTIKECDLCINCFQRLCNKLGCEWNKKFSGDIVKVK